MCAALSIDWHLFHEGGQEKREESLDLADLLTEAPEWRACNYGLYFKV